MRAIFVAAFFVTSAVVSFGATNRPVPAYISKAVADSSRPEDDRKLDAMRKPSELLADARVEVSRLTYRRAIRCR